MDVFVSQKFEGFTAQLRQGDMISLAEMMRDGELRPVIDRSYPLREIRQAIEYSETGRARAKIAIEVQRY
jgi:NADPH:quinone reductase-like Zn-dependent oxidoreductase